MSIHTGPFRINVETNRNGTRRYLVDYWQEPSSLHPGFWAGLYWFRTRRAAERYVRRNTWRTE